MSDYVEKNSKYIVEKLKEMQKALENMSPEELRARIDAGIKDDSYIQYATLERFILSGDAEISHKHVIVAKKDLEDFNYYQGDCRNAEYAIWIERIGKFIYLREKFGSTFPETINHPEDDDGYDLFLPYRKVKRWGDVPERNRLTKKDICSVTGDCPYCFFDEETLQKVTPEMVQLVEDNFPTHAYGESILCYEAWPLRLLFQQAMVMGAWLERNKDKKKAEIKLSPVTPEELKGLPED